VTQYVGIADAHGLESFISLPEKALESELAGQNGNESIHYLVSMLNIRAMANRHRHAVVYRVEIDDADAAAVKFLLDGGRYAEALNKLKKCAKEVEVGKQPGMKKSWRMIPNPSLDPYEE
jgi:hypothetical protein